MKLSLDRRTPVSPPAVSPPLPDKYLILALFSPLEHLFPAREAGFRHRKGAYLSADIRSLILRNYTSVAVGRPRSSLQESGHQGVPGW